MTVSAGRGRRLPGWGQWGRHAGGSRADAAPASRSAATPGASTALTAAALAAPLGLAAASWVVSARQMNEMDMGVATRLGSFGFFGVLWAWMVAAGMLPGAGPAGVRRAHV